MQKKFTPEQASNVSTIPELYSKNLILAYFHQRTMDAASELFSTSLSGILYTKEEKKGNSIPLFRKEFRRKKHDIPP
ncbi:hypothetical protein CEXT_435571 [Caerostris extrusa]|uniref:Transposase n=1 Tax=Caerostris extrusa TaxID=172846 RepID=A0AAV4WUY4_CAEEX|nr:hypothetical protein CEXT_435571 [Caerostris extrusa]